MVRLRCTYCHDAVERKEAVHCAACLALHHGDCHSDYGRCAVHGCGEERVLVAGAKAGVRVTRRHDRILAACSVLAVLVVVAVGLAADAASGRPATWSAVTTASAPPEAVPTPVATTPVVAPPVASTPARTVRDAVVVARDFRLPLSLEQGERLVVTTPASGYTQVVLERTHGRSETLLVAEGGDQVAVHVGDERLVAAPGEVLVLDASPH